MRRCHLGGRKAVEASLHIKDVIYQLSSRRLSDEHYTAKYPLVNMLELGSHASLCDATDDINHVVY